MLKVLVGILSMFLVLDMHCSRHTTGCC